MATTSRQRPRNSAWPVIVDVEYVQHRRVHVQHAQHQAHTNPTWYHRRHRAWHHARLAQQQTCLPTSA